MYVLDPPYFMISSVNIVALQQLFIAQQRCYKQSSHSVLEPITVRHKPAEFHLCLNKVVDLLSWPSGKRSVAGVQLGPGASVYQRIISNDFYAHDEQGVNPGQVRGFDGVLYKL